MALIKCHECGGKVSTDAAACPGCGAMPRPSQSAHAGYNPMRLAKLALAAVAAIGAYNAYSSWSDTRSAKKAEVAEFMRRNSLTPEQRIAEDAAKANKLAIENAERNRISRVAAREIAEAPFKAACQEALMGTLYDPAAAQITKNFGEIAANGNYKGWIEGRAKNAFGAYIIGGWTCDAYQSGNSITVTKVFQYKP